MAVCMEGIKITCPTHSPCNTFASCPTTQFREVMSIPLGWHILPKLITQGVSLQKQSFKMSGFGSIKNQVSIFCETQGEKKSHRLCLHLWSTGTTRIATRHSERQAMSLLAAVACSYTWQWGKAPAAWKSSGSGERQYGAAGVLPCYLLAL